jgi:excisionase family DNA binding protein
MERLTLTVPEIAEALGVSRMSAYAAVRAGVIPSIRIGRRVLVPRLALDQLIETATAALSRQSASGELLLVEGLQEGR